MALAMLAPLGRFCVAKELPGWEVAVFVFCGDFEGFGVF
jgi:hypothetical protein